MRWPEGERHGCRHPGERCIARVRSGRQVAGPVKAHGQPVGPAPGNMVRHVRHLKCACLVRTAWLALWR